MVRQVKPDEYAARRAQILAAALDLIRRKGYQQMTIADVQAALNISKGAFYHYFGSKRALLDGIVESMTADGAAALRAVVSDPSLDALTKLRRYFTTAVAWKSAHDSEVAVTMRMWRHENNAVLRQKLSAEAMRTTTPLLAAMIRQGRAEGVFDTTYPDEAATIIAGMGLQLADALIDAFTTAPTPEDSRGARVTLVHAYLEAVERILGAPPGSVTDLTAKIAAWPPPTT